ncbi:hypothetical protein Freya10_5 [Polaribacter phage Freya_10]|nr:hypothetical protein Freya8_2 [Polaribacter phage Freya_8]QQV91221.1 hypothetical protein Freya9_5 [Polaribacter phage Freya_9]QQV91298.1 hypothetical protein Freya10_5 [Polaribacter phage Freya_10]
MDILKSIFSLAKTNNGFFKSDKQSSFLISKMDSTDGFIGSVTSGYNSCVVFAKYDNKGIINITKHTKKGDVTMFERKKEGVLTSLEIKKLKTLKRRHKKLETEIINRQKSFDSGKYNGTMDKSTYCEDTIRRFNYMQKGKIESLKNLELLIIKIN